MTHIKGYQPVGTGEKAIPPKGGSGEIRLKMSKDITNPKIPKTISELNALLEKCYEMGARNAFQFDFQNRPFFELEPQIRGFKHSGYYNPYRFLEEDKNATT